MRVQEETGKITVWNRSYEGKLFSYELPREDGTEVRIGGTASTSVLHSYVKLVGLYQKEDSEDQLADVILPKTQKTVVGVRTLGNVLQGRKPVILETFNLDEFPRLLVMCHLPKDYKKHFINVDIVKNDELIRRLRIDPFLGESKIV